MSAENNLRIFSSYETEWAQWRNKAIKYANFYRNKQYSRRESKSFQKMGLKPISVNIVRPLLAQRNAILTSSRPTWKVVPLKGASKEVADILQRFLVGKWNSDYVDIQIDQILLDMARVGVGYMFIDLATFLDNATFDILIERLNWKWVYPDPNCTKFDFSDAEHIVVRKKVGLNYAQVKFRMSEIDLRDAMGDVLGVNPMSTQVNVIDRFSKYPTEQVGYKVKEEHKAYMSIDKMPPTVFYTSKLKKQVEREKRQWYKDLKSLEKEGKIDLTTLDSLNIYRCLSVGYHTVYEGVMNIRDYPIVPFVNEMSDEATKIDSEVVFVEGIQEALNKFYMLTLHNALLTGNVRFLAPAGAIKNKTQFQKTWSLPGAVNEWDPQPDLPNSGKPDVIQPGQLSSAFYGLAKDLQDKAEYQMSMFAPVRGEQQGSNDTYSTMASLQSFGTQRLHQVARRIDIMLAKAGEVAIQFIQNYTDNNELLEYIDDRPFIDSGQPNQDFGTLQPAGKLNEFQINEGVIREIKRDSRIGKYAVKVLTQPNLSTDRMIKAGLLSNMVMNKSLPATPGVMRKIFDLLEVPGYLEIVEELASHDPLSQKSLKQLVKNMQVLQKMNVLLQKESLNMAKKLEISDFRFKLEKEMGNITDEIEKDKNTLMEQIQALLGQISQAPTQPQAPQIPVNGGANARPEET